jgi:O-antigen/teichoic acid export membrane protein
MDFLGYPAEYDRSATLLRILAVQIPLVAFTMICGTILIASNREGPRTIAALIAAFFSPILNVALIPLFDARFENGALGSAISALIIEGFITVVVIRLMEPHTYDWTNAKTAIRCLAAAVPMAAIMYLALPLGMLGVLFGGGATYLIAALLTRAVTLRELLELPAMVLGSRTRKDEPTEAMNLSPSPP